MGNEPKKIKQLDINETEQKFKLATQVGTTPTVRCYLYENGKQWIDSSNAYSASFAYGEDHENSTSMVTIAGNVSSTENYVDFQFEASDLPKDGEYFCQVQLADEDNDKRFVFKDGSLNVLKSPISGSTTDLVLTSVVNWDIITNVGTLPWSSASNAASWGSITGTITDQTDLVDGFIEETSSKNQNDVLKYNGSEWVAVPEGTTFTFSIATFADNQSTTQLIGTGVWKAIGAITFIASYDNGPATGGYITHTGWTNLTLTGAGFDETTSSTEAKNYPAAIGSYTWTCNATDGTDSDTSSVSVSFLNYIYYGITTTLSGYTEADIEGLASKVISNTKGRTITVAPSTNEYICYSYPKRLGTVTFTVGGFTGGFQDPETVSVTNSAGFTEDYYVYRSTNDNLGSTTVTVS